MADDTSKLVGLGQLYGDLVVAVGVIALTLLAIRTDAPATVRAPLAFLSVFLVPGYTLTTVLFPAGNAPIDSHNKERPDGLTTISRAVLAIGLSLALVILLGLLINALPQLLSSESFLSGIALVTGLLLPAAVVRRRALPAGTAFVPLARASPVKSTGFDMLTIVLVASVLFAGGAVAYSVGTGSGDTGVTELYFLTEDENGELQAGDYPTDLDIGETETVSIAVGNREGQSQTYTVIAQLQRAQRQNQTTIVQERERIHETEVTVADGETRTDEISLTAGESGEYRLEVLLYVGAPPEQPRSANAYREVHLWLDVNSPLEA